MAGNLGKYVLMFGITAGCIYIIYRMIKERQANASTNQVALPYSDTSTTTQLNELYSIEDTKNGSGITNFKGGSIDASGIYTANTTNHLRDYCIKASFNSAFTGKHLCQDMVKYVLQRGCRFLDFSVYIVNGIPIVAYSSSTTDLSYTSFTSASPSLSLAGVFSTILSNAFSNTSPNPNDPLFIQLHINTYLQDGYQTIARTIASSFSSSTRLYQGSDGKATQVTMDTNITDMLGKIVLIVDGTTSQGFQNYTMCSTTSTGEICYDLSSYINMISGQGTLRLYTEDQLSRQAINPPDPSVYLMRIVLPSPGFFFGVVNPDNAYLVVNYGAQIVAQAFYYNDSKLRSYEAMFRSAGSAFVPLSAAINYYQV